MNVSKPVDMLQQALWFGISILCSYKKSKFNKTALVIAMIFPVYSNFWTFIPNPIDFKDESKRKSRSQSQKMNMRTDTDIL